MRFQPDGALTPGVYRHYKGVLYNVLGVALDPDADQSFAVYIPQSGDYAGKLRSRPLDSFTEQVSIPESSYVGPRFCLVRERNFLGEIE